MRELYLHSRSCFLMDNLDNSNFNQQRTRGRDSQCFLHHQRFMYFPLHDIWWLVFPENCRWSKEAGNISTKTWRINNNLHWTKFDMVILCWNCIVATPVNWNLKFHSSWEQPVKEPTHVLWIRCSCHMKIPGFFIWVYLYKNKIVLNTHCFMSV